MQCSLQWTTQCIMEVKLTYGDDAVSTKVDHTVYHGRKVTILCFSRGKWVLAAEEMKAYLGVGRDIDESWSLGKCESNHFYQVWRNFRQSVQKLERVETTSMEYGSTKYLTVIMHYFWWHRTLSVLLTLCEGNPPVTGGFFSQKGQ